MAKAYLIYDSTERNADLYYATGFRSIDAFLFFEHGGKKYLVMNDLEIDRARREADVDRVLSLSSYMKKAEGKVRGPTQTDVISEVLSDHKIKDLVVPRDMPFTLVDGLRKRGYRVEEGPWPFYPQRIVKKRTELKCIIDAQRVVFAAIAMARTTLAATSIKGRRLMYKGRSLTSERLRTMIDIFLLERGFHASDTIVSCGRHSIDPHDIGTGPLYAHQSIIVDIFPRSIKTLFYGDATRTFCRGHAPELLKRMYATVKECQERAIGMVREGVNGRSIHEANLKFFADRGYETGEKGGRMQGFFHGTGHSIGLEIHEEPARINVRDFILKAGNVMSVEPGLYYPHIGGVRIEDLVHVTKTGCEVLGRFPKQLEV